VRDHLAVGQPEIRFDLGENGARVDQSRSPILRGRKHGSEKEYGGKEAKFHFGWFLQGG